MSPQPRMLLWKEWRERRTQFLVCLIWMVGGTVYTVAYEWSREFRAPAASFFNTIVLFGLFAPIFVAMRTSLGETTDRTRSFTGALPISAQRRGWIRLAGGAAVLVMPILVGAALISLCLALGWLEQAPPQPPRPREPHYLSLPNRESLSALAAVALVWRVTAVTVCSAIEFHVLLSLIGTALRAEAHAGFAGAVMGVLWFLGAFLGGILAMDAGEPGAAAWIGAVNPQAMIINCTYGDARGTYGDLWILCGMRVPLLANMLIQLTLATWFVRRYSRRLPGRAIETVRKARPLRWRPWSLPLSNRSIALIWLSLRQAAPMCIPGLLLASLMALLSVIVAPHYGGESLRRFADELPGSMSVIGLLWAVVVGAGVFAAEIDWRVGEFWRTRPIAFGRLFAAKFFVGLVAVLLVLDGTTIAVSCTSPNWGTHGVNWAYIACFVPLHAVMFAVAVGWTCALRRPVFGGLAAVLSFLLLEIGIDSWEVLRPFDPMNVCTRLTITSEVTGRAIDLTSHGYPVVAAGMAVILVASILIAGFALRRYDPRRQSG